MCPENICSLGLQSILRFKLFCVEQCHCWLCFSPCAPNQFACATNKLPFPSRLGGIEGTCNGSSSNAAKSSTDQQARAHVSYNCFWLIHASYVGVRTGLFSCACRSIIVGHFRFLCNFRAFHSSLNLLSFFDSFSLDFFRLFFGNKICAFKLITLSLLTYI